MKILMIHNRYLQRGGEDESTDNEIALLRRYGHQVDFLEMDNRVIKTRSLLRTGIEAVWSTEAYHLVREHIRQKSPDVVHIQNFFPLFSPAIHYAAKAENKPVVQSLRNYRLLCLNGLFFRDGHNCEDCFKKFIPWPGVFHRCYRENLLGSMSVVSMLIVHRLLRTWERQVDLFITLSEFARQKFIAGGLPAEKVVVKPNFVTDDGLNRRCNVSQRSYMLFVGRLSSEKGVLTMLQAWEKLSEHIPLKIVGDGPLVELVQIKSQEHPQIEWLGWKEPVIVYELMRNACALLFPTQLYETFGRVIVEAFANGTPVIASNIGSAAELIKDRYTGLLFRPGNADDLAAKVEWACSHPQEMAEMGRRARCEYQEKYTAEKNYEMLMRIYEQALHDWAAPLGEHGTVNHDQESRSPNPRLPR